MPNLPRSPRVDLVVTPEIIAAATKEDSSHCMLADAVRLAYPGAKNVTVDIQTIRFSDPTKGEAGARFTYLTPRIAQLGLVDFDAGVPPEPFSCVLRGAHVAPMRGRNKGSKPISEAGAANLRETVKKARQYTTTRSSEGHPTDSRERVGGAPPPLGALAHGNIGRRITRTGIPTARRRTFGLRGLQRNHIPMNPEVSAEK